MEKTDIQTMIRELSIDVSESLQSALKKFETVHEKYLILKDQDKFSGLLSLTSLRRACLKVNVPVTEDIPLSAIAPELCSSFIYDFEKDKNVFDYIICERPKQVRQQNRQKVFVF